MFYLGKHGDNELIGLLHTWYGSGQLTNEKWKNIYLNENVKIYHPNIYVNFC